MQNKKKILFFLPGGIGGAERMTLTVAKLLPKEQYHVKFVIIGTKKTIYNFIPKDADVDCIPVHNKYCLSTLRIYHKIKQEHPSLVFVSQVAYNPRVIIASRMANVPVIARSSGMVGKYPGMKFLSVKATYKYANLIIAQQDEMKEEIIRLLGVQRDNIVALHNPLDLSTIDKSLKAESPYVDGDAVNFVNVARIAYAKGQDIAIKAFSKVKSHMPNAQLFFVGSYDEKDIYFQNLNQLIADNHLQDSVHFVGFDKNPYRWVKYCDGFVFPSRREGLPNALIEASYIGRPCAASRCLPIITTIIKDGYNGYTVEVEDVDGLAESMTKCIQLKEFQMIYKPSTANDFIEVFNNISK